MDNAPKTAEQQLADALALVKRLQEAAAKVEVGSRVSFAHNESLATAVVKAIGDALAGTALVVTDQGGFELTKQLSELSLYTETKSMANTLKSYRAGYEPSISANGRKSLNKGDAFGRLVVGATATEVCALADAIMGEGAGHHAARYSKLNVGQQRMNAGNRVRASFKRGDTPFETIEAQWALIIARRNA